MIMHYQATGIVGVQTLEIAANAISELVSAAIKPLVTEAAVYEGLRARVVSPVPTDVVFSTQGTGRGTVDGDSLPTYVSGLISLRTGFAGPSFRGRKYVPFPGELHNDDHGQPTTGYLTLLNTLGVALTTPVNVDAGDEPYDLQPGLYRKARIPDFIPWDHALLRASWTHWKRRFDSVTETSVIVTPVG